MKEVRNMHFVTTEARHCFTQNPFSQNRSFPEKLFLRVANGISGIRLSVTKEIFNPNPFII